MRMNRIGQSVFEYATILAIVVAGLITMRLYMKRALEGRLRSSVDEIGDLYRAGKVTSKFTTEQTDTIEEKETFGLDASETYKQGVSRTELLKSAEIKRSALGPDAERIDIDFKNESLF